VPAQSARAESKIHGLNSTVRRMSNARENVRNGLLLEGLAKPVDLNAVDWHVRHRNPSASPPEVQNETLELIRGLVSEGLVRLGSVSEKGGRFFAWRRSLDHSIHKISHVYVKHYDDPERWMFAAWLSLTAKGKGLAECLEEKDIDLYRGKGV
jgi:hypothetical protein